MKTQLSKTVILFCLLVLSLLAMPPVSLAEEPEGDKFYSQVYSYPKVGESEQAALKEEIFSSLLKDAHVSSIKSKLTYLGKIRENAVLRDLWPAVGSLQSAEAAQSLLELFTEHNPSVSERFYSLMRRRFGEIAGTEQVKDALSMYMNPFSANEKNLAYGLLEKVKGDGFSELFRDTYNKVSSFEDAKAMFRLISFQNTEEAFSVAMSILASLEKDIRFDDDQKKYLMVNTMTFFTAPEIKEALLKSMGASDYWQLISSVSTLGNYGGQDVADALQQMYEAKGRKAKRSAEGEKPTRDEVLLRALKRSIDDSKRVDVQKARRSSDSSSNNAQEGQDRAYRSLSSNKDLTLDDLARQYSPVMRLSRAGTGTNENNDMGVTELINPGVYDYYDFIPMSIQDLVKSPVIPNRPAPMPKLINIQDSQDQQDLSNVINKLGDYQGAYYIDFKSMFVKGGIFVPQDYTNFKDNFYLLYPTPTVYCYAFENKTKVFPYAVQYWFFYFYNEWTKHHVGDWETITVFFDHNKEPVEVCYSTHYEARRHPFSLLEHENLTHPHVFVANGGHGSYAKSGNTSYGLSTDNHQGDKQILYEENLNKGFSYSLDILTNKDKEMTSHWLNFDGMWGEGEKDGIPGPKFRTDAPTPTLGDLAKNEPTNPDSCEERINTKIFGDDAGPWYWADGYPFEEPTEDLKSIKNCLKRPELLEAKEISPIIYEFKWNKRGIDERNFYLAVFDEEGNNVNDEKEKLFPYPAGDYQCTGEECSVQLGPFASGKHYWAMRAENTETKSAWTDLQEFNVKGTSGKIAVVFVLDESGSVDKEADGTSSWQLEQKGFKDALNSLPADSSIDIAVITFDDNADIKIALTTLNSANIADFETALSSSQGNGGTSIDRAIDEAVKVLDSSNATTKIIFLATDGGSNESSAEKSAEAAKNEGIILEPIAIGKNADQSLLDSIASNPPVPKPKDFNEFATVVVNKITGAVGQAINFGLEPDVVDFGVLNPETIHVCGGQETVMLKNNSLLTVLIKELKIIGKNRDAFRIESVNGYPFSLPFPSFPLRANMSIPIVISFTSESSEAEYNAILSVQGMDNGWIQTSYSSILKARLDPDSPKCLTLKVVDASPTIAEIDQNGRPLVNENGVYRQIEESDVNSIIENDTCLKRQRIGLVADGNARLLIRSLTSVTSGTIRFWMSDKENTYNSAETQALLYPLSHTVNNDEDGKTSLDVQIAPISTADGDMGQATAILRAGERFPGIENISETNFYVNACLVDQTTGDCTEVTWKNIKEKRAPVVLIHGLWADPETWEDSEDGGNPSGMRIRLQESRFSVKADYTYNGAKGPTDTMKPDETNLAYSIKNPNGTDGICNQEVKQGFACTRADIVAHSMGGLVTRKFVHDNTHYKSNLNFKQGAIRRFISVATPHWGSPLANFLRMDNDRIDNCISDNDPDQQGIQNKFFNYLYLGIDWKFGIDSAIKDLAIGSELLGILASKPQQVKTFAIFSNFGTILKFDIPGTSAYNKMIEFIIGCSHERMYGTGISSDGIVAVCSANAQGCNQDVAVCGVPPDEKCYEDEYSRISLDEYTQELKGIQHMGMGTNEEIFESVRNLLNGEAGKFSDSI